MKRAFLICSAVAAVGFPALARGDLNYEGMSYVNFNAPADFNNAASNNALIGIQQLNANTVALNIWDFTPSLTSTTIAPDYTRYSSPLTEVQYAINYIHSLGMNVMLKPMVDVDNGSWRGMIDPPANQVNNWFASYQSFIDSYATLAEQNVNNGVTLFSVGCELNDMEQYTSNWTSLISSVRGIYSGKLTYAANWSVNNLNEGGYTKINWWNQLDYVGIDAYFPLTDQANPSEAQLQTAWAGVANNINTWRQSAGLTNKDVIFTEVGYQSTPGTNENPAGVTQTTQDIQEQANCYQALLQTMTPQPWWNGAFWWACEPGAVSSGDTNFTPVNKPATDAVLESYYLPQATWSQAVTANWSTGGNWVSGAAPAGQMDVVFNTGSTLAYTVSLTGASSARNLTAQSDNVTVNLAAHPLSLSGGVDVTYGARLTFGGGGNVTVAQSVQVDAGATLDLANSALLMNFTMAANDPTSRLLPLLSSGYNNGTWTGTGITSSAAASSGGKFAVGYADGNVDHVTGVGPNQFLMEYTLAADANLDGSVGIQDLLIIAQNFGQTGKDWSHGDFTYDPAGSVGIADLLLVAQNFGQSISLASTAAPPSLSPAWQLTQTSVPEPATAALLAGSLAILSARRPKR